MTPIILWPGFLPSLGISFQQLHSLVLLVVSVDRFLAIHLHLRYQELVTHKRVVAVVISVWVLSAVLCLSQLWVPRDIYLCLMLIILVVGFVLTTMVYIRIYLAVRRHKNQIQSQRVQQVEQNGEIANFATLTKSAVGIFYVYLVFLICYLPFIISLVTRKVSGPSIRLKQFYHFSVTLVFLNSSLNPVIYCWEMRHIRLTIMDILRDVFCYRNRASH